MRINQENLNYGIIGNCKSSALIKDDSSIDWCCLPEFDSPSVFAKILDQLNTSNPKAIGFDIFFSEKDKQSPEEIIKSYDLIPSDIAALQKLKSHDDIFAEKLKESKSITAVLGSNVPVSYTHLTLPTTPYV